MHALKRLLLPWMRYRLLLLLAPNIPDSSRCNCCCCYPVAWTKVVVVFWLLCRLPLLLLLPLTW
jgi:hypothetical protein